MSKSTICIKDTRNKFEKWDDKVGQWYHALGVKSKFKFWLIFPFMFVADGLMLPIRGINKLLKRGKRHV